MARLNAFALMVIGLLGLGGWLLAGRALEASRAAAAVQAAEDVVFTTEDVRIHAATLDWALENRLDTLTLGAIIALTGQRFVGGPYTPHTLEIEGPEKLVVNLREFDCVTFVESTLALARVIRDGSRDFGDFTAQLRLIRYRDGVLDGYPSRLHYFSEWIADNAESGLVDDVTLALGGVVDREPIDFMTTHAEAYPSFVGRPDRVAAIREIERVLSGRPRYYLPEDRIEEAAAGIRDGDVIAATSRVAGLDIAHTGFALWRDGRLHLMHAPLVGRALEVSEEPLAVRIRRLGGQDGIMVARPR